jgi:NitT/TauT family transport system substrate-binding protein
MMSQRVASARWPWRGAAVCVLAWLAWAAVASAGDAALKPASFLPQWSPQAQFAGYYMAYEKGMYRQHGLDLTILPGGPQNPAAEALEKGRATFATMWLSTAIERRAAGVRLLNLGQIVQRSALMLVAKRSAGMRGLQDLDGKRVGVWGGDFRIQPLALFRKSNMRVRIVPQAYSVNLFLRDGVEATSAMWYNEYHTILNSGFDPEELLPIFYHEHGLNFPEDGIYVLEKTHQEDPARSQAFLAASLEGWRYAFAHPSEALDVVLKYMAAANLPANRVHQQWMLARMQDLILPSGGNASQLGELTGSDYDRVAGELRAADAIRLVPPFSTFRAR